MIHNEAAGDRSQPAHLLHQVLTDAGYRPRFARMAEDWQQAIAEPFDLIVLIGGDGTVTKAAGLLGARDVPVALLPTGTANNVAKTLGIAGDARDVVASWREGFVLPVDVWNAMSEAGPPAAFVEALGGGIIGIVIARGHELEPPRTSSAGSSTVRCIFCVRLPETSQSEPGASRWTGSITPRFSSDSRS